LTIFDKKGAVMTQGQGKWYLVFTYRDTFASMAGRLEHPKVLLSSATEGEAIAEAEALWMKMVARHAPGPEEKGTGRGFDHVTVQDLFGDIYNPRVIYKIDLKLATK